MTGTTSFYESFHLKTIGCSLLQRLLDELLELTFILLSVISLAFEDGLNRSTAIIYIKGLKSVIDRDSDLCGLACRPAAEAVGRTR